MKRVFRYKRVKYSIMFCWKLFGEGVMGRGDLIYIDIMRGDISGNYDRVFVCFELVEDLVMFVLLFVIVNGWYCVSMWCGYR